MSPVSFGSGHFSEGRILSPWIIFRNKVRELTLILADKIVDKKLLDELWEELRMLKVVKYAEEKGMEKGMEKGKETVAKNMLSLGIEDELVIKATGLDKSIIDKLKKSLSSGAQ